MRILSVWVVELIKLLGRQQLHPLNAKCPMCHQMVRLHYNYALYEGSRYCVHYTANIRCLGSGAPAQFDPRPNEDLHFKAPKSLVQS